MIGRLIGRLHGVVSYRYIVFLGIYILYFLKTHNGIEPLSTQPAGVIYVFIRLFSSVYRKSAGELTKNMAGELTKNMAGELTKNMAVVSREIFGGRFWRQ